MAKKKSGKSKGRNRPRGGKIKGRKIVSNDLKSYGSLIYLHDSKKSAVHIYPNSRGTVWVDVKKRGKITSIETKKSVREAKIAAISWMRKHPKG